MTESFDVVVVGVGPVGAVAAGLAGMFGLRTIALERATEIEPRPRAVGFDHEAMRVFGNLGIVDEIADDVMPYRPSEYRNDRGERLRKIDTAPPPHRLGWSPNYVFLQPRLEKALRDRASGLAEVELHLGAEVTDVQQDDAGVVVAVRDQAGYERRVEAQYLLACDGGSSPLRTRLGLGMDDLEFDEPWLVVDVLLQPGAGQGLPDTNVQYCEPARPSTFVVGPGNHRRWEFMINAGEDPADIVQPEAIHKLLSRWLPRHEYELWRAATYRFHALVLRQWQYGRIFFLGDAAHMTPPFLAQGMCQGIRDASNLVWKLAAHRQGQASDALLDTYQLERDPHVRQVTLVAKKFGKLICERDPRAAARRDARMLEELTANPSGIIRQSLIPDLTAGFLAPGAFAAQGTLFPQPFVRAINARTGLLDEFTGMCFRLVVRRDVDATDIAAAMAQHLHDGGFDCRLVNLVAADPRTPEEYRENDEVLHGWMSEAGIEIALVRPDHYVFGAGAASDAGALLEAAARGLQEQPLAQPC